MFRKLRYLVWAFFHRAEARLIRKMAKDIAEMPVQIYKKGS